ncbi:hypothetical protein MBM_03380 [Drepanopeziza brunnea f. sp. 'multigermtubi' MB_m1]|uniref:Uncharacterized protein n=1 Tax=Marssonina brunnea f. sp. multigermtubi (strain MB_m1) TaxID=1072389 RepID=K1X084_MARBU|nr:uncharacterized protein MBM_03380 [Drepanopeziza brunnea f. sp. 'multigermtubi' MB_m1]EKD18387.1 hypothetical protein MBM_03380 [Drepanopeziza brunnea f. sp. 'multigermtubi' MB_m1]
MAGTTYALVKHDRHRIANAQINSDPFAYKACQKTASAVVSGVDCNGARMWNCLDRYPTECLEALGNIYKSEALAAKKQTCRNPAGGVHIDDPGRQSSALILRTDFGHIGSRRYLCELLFGQGHHRCVKHADFEDVMAAFLADPAADRYLVDVKGGDIRRGPWLDIRLLRRRIHLRQNMLDLFVGGPDGGTSTTICTPSWWTKVVEDASPFDYVHWSFHRVQDCGFHLVHDL